MKNLFPMVLILVVAGFLVNLAVSAADTGTVAATVTAQNVSVAVSDGTITYGTMTLSATSSTLADSLNDQQSAVNDGNVTADFNIRGQDSLNWTLANDIGVNNEYKHEFSTSTFPGTALTTGYQTLATGVAANATTTFDLMLTAPSATTFFTEQSVDVTVQAVAN